MGTGALFRPSTRGDDRTIGGSSEAVPDHEVISVSEKAVLPMPAIDRLVIVELQAGMMDHDVCPPSDLLRDQGSGPLVGVRRSGDSCDRRRREVDRSGEDEEPAEYRHARDERDPDDLGSGEDSRGVIVDLLRHSRILRGPRPGTTTLRSPSLRPNASVSVRLPSRASLWILSSVRLS